MLPVTCFFKSGNTKDLHSYAYTLLDLTGESESETKWCESIMLNLGIDTSKVNMKDAAVYRYHCPLCQLQYYFNNSTMLENAQV